MLDVGDAAVQLGQPLFDVRRDIVGGQHNFALLASFAEPLVQHQGVDQVGATFRGAATGQAEFHEGFVLATGAGQQQSQVVVGPGQGVVQLQGLAEIFFGRGPFVLQVKTVSAVGIDVCILGIAFQRLSVIPQGIQVIARLVVQHGEAVVSSRMVGGGVYQLLIQFHGSLMIAFPFDRAGERDLHLGLLGRGGFEMSERAGLHGPQGTACGFFGRAEVPGGQLGQGPAEVLATRTGGQSGQEARGPQQPVPSCWHHACFLQGVRAAGGVIRTSRRGRCPAPDR